jgi:hypothetical protein
MLDGVPHLERPRANCRNYERDLALLLGVVALRRASEDCAGSSRLRAGHSMHECAGQVHEGWKRSS